MKRIKKENKEKILEKINPDNYEISWNEEGVPYKFKKKTEIKKGKISKARGARFELKVRKDLEEKGRVVDKWTNNVDLEQNKLVSSKKIFNPFKKIMVPGAGFPDFITIKHIHDESYSVIGVEVKTNGTLSKTEKEKCAWYLKNKIFSQIWIAKQGETPKGVPRDFSKEKSTRGKRGEIVYDDFKEKYGKKYNNP